jgi:hypothetical protein
MPRGYPDVPQIVTEHVVPNTQIGGPLAYTASCHEMPRGYPDVPQIVTEHVVPNTQIVSENVVPNNATYVNRDSSVHQQLDDEFANADSFL